MPYSSTHALTISFGWWYHAIKRPTAVARKTGQNHTKITQNHGQRRQMCIFLKVTHKFSMFTFDRLCTCTYKKKSRNRRTSQRSYAGHLHHGYFLITIFSKLIVTTYSNILIASGTSVLLRSTLSSISVLEKHIFLF